jgi:hypothetical protein
VALIFGCKRNSNNAPAMMKPVPPRLQLDTERSPLIFLAFIDASLLAGEKHALIGSGIMAKMAGVLK